MAASAPRFMHPLILTSRNSQLPTTFDDNASDSNASAAFLSSGRSSSLLEHSTMYYRSIREDISRTNVGPGSYNLAYSWRTDDNNHSHFPSASTETGPASPIRGSPKSSNAGQYDRPWLVEKTAPVLSAEELRFIEDCDADDVEAVKSLPSY